MKVLDGVRIRAWIGRGQGKKCTQPEKIESKCRKCLNNIRGDRNCSFLNFLKFLIFVH